MGLFKKKQKTQPLNISSIDLCNLLNKAILLATEDVNTNSYILGPEIMFEYNNTIHFIGIKYDKKQAKKEHQNQFNEKYMNVYLDKQYFHTVQDLFHTAMIENTRLQDITNDIIVSNEYKEIL